MRRGHREIHFFDKDDNPAGGTSYGTGFAISWQNGPLGRGEAREDPNGAFVEDIIAAAIGRLEFYQRTKFNCEFNKEAIAHLNRALRELEDRTTDREDQGIEGTHAI